MNTIIASSRILCTDTPKHDRHLISLHSDHSLSCDCGATALTEAQRLGALVMLGQANAARRSCAGLASFLLCGMPSLIGDRSADRGEWGAWKQMWVLYGSNSLVRHMYQHLVAQRDKEHAATLDAAQKAFLTCARYRNGMSRLDFADGVRFTPNAEIKVGASVALFASDSWEVPLQKDWLESVGKAKPIIDGRFVVGVNPTQPGFVYAIDGTDDAGFEIREFAVVNGKLGKVAASK